MGKPTSDVSVMEYIVKGIKSRCDLIVGITTGGAIGMTAEERLRAVPVIKPELASCNAGSMNFVFSQIADKISKPIYDWEIPFVKNTYKTPFLNTFDSLGDFIRIMQDNGTKPEFEIYDIGMVNNLAYFLEKGVIKTPIYIQFVLGILGGLPANLDNLLFIYNTAKKQLGDDFIWSCAAAGKNQFEIAAMSVLLGGNIRIGLEDNLYLERGVLAKSNAEGVEKAKGILQLFGHEPATLDEARKALFGK